MADEFVTSLPNQETTAFLKRDTYASEGKEDVRNAVNKVVDLEDGSLQQMKELVIGSQEHSAYRNDIEPDEDGTVEIIGHELHTGHLERILRELVSLETFTYSQQAPGPVSARYPTLD